MKKRLTAVLMSLFMVLSIMPKVQLGVRAEGETTGTVYKLVTEINANGGDYLIVSTNTAGNAFAMTNPGGTSAGASMGKTSVTIIESGSDLYIGEIESSSIWHAAPQDGGFDLTNGSDSLEGKSGKVLIYNERQYADRHWSYSNLQLTNSQYSIYYDGTKFYYTTGSNHREAYLFEKTDGVIPIGPSDDPISGKTVDITPSTSNPQESREINVGDVLAINITNGSTHDAYDFTATSSDTSIADILGNDTVHIEKSDIGLLTVKGLATGNADIIIQNNNTTGSQYTRKATIHVTVVGSGDPVQVTGVTLDPTTVSMEEGETKSLSATVTPTNATNKSVSWSSDNESVATVDNGVVTAVAIGSAIITVTTEDGGFFMSCTVIVTKAAEKPKYALVNEPQDDKDYLIVDLNAVGNGHVLKNPGGTSGGTSLGSTDLTVRDSGSYYYIVPSATDVIWKVTKNGNGFNLTNNGDYLEGKGGEVKIYSSQQYADRSWSYVDNQLKHTGGQNTYIVYYDNGFKSTYNSTSEKVYFYEKLVPVTNISLTHSELSLAIGDTEDLSAVVEPLDATFNEVTWSSGDETIATIENGVVTAHSAGATTITAIADGVTASCTVIVTNPSVAVESITIEPAALTLAVGNSETLSATVEPMGTSQEVYWTSSNESIAIVDTNGKVTAITTGTTVIRVASAENEQIYAECSVTVTSKPVKVTVYIGTELKDTISDVPGEADYIYTLPAETGYTFSIESVKRGETSVEYITTDDGKSITIAADDMIDDITITLSKTEIAVESISLDKSSLNMITGNEAALEATVLPKDALNKSVSWISSNTSVATVDETGKVTAVAAGMAIITASAGEVSATCEVIVSDPLPETVTITVNVGEVSYTVISGVQKNTDYDYVIPAESGYTFSVVSVNCGETSIEYTSAADGKSITIAGSGITADITITLSKTAIPVDSISLNKNSLDMIAEDEFTLEATVLPVDALDKAVTWTSSAENVVTVDTNGKVTAVAAGTAIITAAAGSAEATCTVTVIPKNVVLTVIYSGSDQGETINEVPSAQNYSYILPEKTGYIISVESVKRGEADIAYTVAADGKSITIAGSGITADITIVLKKEAAPVSVVFNGTGADDIQNPAQTAVPGTDYTFSINKDAAYEYEVSAKQGTADLTVAEGSNGSYTIAGAEINITDGITITIVKTKKIVPAVSEFASGSKIWLVKVTEAAGSKVTYSGQEMFWSEKYKAYVTLVTGNTAPAPSSSDFVISEGTSDSVDYSGDANGTGKIDMNDVQFIYNLYSGKYAELNDSVTAAKVLSADFNGDGVVDINDANAVISVIRATKQS